jgi:hypothetical protein
MMPKQIHDFPIPSTGISKIYIIGGFNEPKRIAIVAVAIVGRRSRGRDGD